MTAHEQLIRDVLREQAASLSPSDRRDVPAAARRAAARRRKLVAASAAFCVVAVIAGATALADSLDHRAPSAHRPTVVTGALVPLKPRLPKGVSTCDSYELSVTTVRGTTALTSCAGEAGLAQLPSIVVEVGAVFTIGGAESDGGVRPGTTVSYSPPQRLEQQQTTFRALTPGMALISVHGAYCLPEASVGTKGACALLAVSVR